MIDEILNNLGTIIESNVWIAPFIALIAGVLTSFSPCAISSVPLVIGYVGGASGNDSKRAFRLSGTFAIGMAITFTALGSAAALLGKVLSGAGSWWYIVLGVLMVLMALQTFEIYNFIPSTHFVAKTSKKGYIGALLAGILSGIFSSPCATPALVVLLGLVARGGNVVWGVFLLLIYAIGHSFLVLVAGTSVGFVKKLTSSEKYGKASAILKYVMGVGMLLIAFYMFYLGF